MGRLLIIAVAGVLAVTGVRSVSVVDLIRRDPHLAAIEQAPATLVVVARREGKLAPDTRFAPCVVSAVFSVGEVERIPITGMQLSLARHPVVEHSAYCARGPPIG